MNNHEIIFRIAVGVLFVTGWILIRLRFQRKLGHVEKISSRHQRREKLSYALVSFSFAPLFVYVFSSLLDLFHLPLPEALRWVGGAMGLAGSGLLWWTHQVLGKNWSGVLEISKDHTLVTEGPYHFVRHPMYSAFFTMGAGMLLLSANGLVGAANLAAVAYMYLVRVDDEEAMMLEQFGDSYSQYMAKTGRLLPRFISGANG
jgi:protein-S-isoprenylcysteine O-methyltransferase Ste14